MNYNEQTTIAAISTAMSNSGIGIVRMTGEDSVEIADRIYSLEKRIKSLVGRCHIPFIMAIYAMVTR